MNEFTNPSPHYAAVRLSHLYETARRIRRLGIHSVDVDPSALHVTFFDQRYGVRARLTVEPWHDWSWSARTTGADSSASGPLTRGRTILWRPYPRQVVRAYQDFIRWACPPPRRKLHQGKGR